MALLLAGGDEALKKLNLGAQEAKDGVLQALASGSAYSEPAYKVFKCLPATAREAIVRAGLTWIKDYTASTEFAAAYFELRDREKPEAPEPRPAAEEQHEKMKADMEKSIAEMRQNMAAMDAETKKAMETAIQEMRAQLERMERDPQQKEYMRQATAMSADEDKKRYEEEIRAWEQRYPVTAKMLIRRRIQEFLAVSAGVDYAAKLVARNDKMVFAKDEYEQKAPEWKLCFRAGKEATEAARLFAKSWLAELERN